MKKSDRDKKTLIRTFFVNASGLIANNPSDLSGSAHKTSSWAALIHPDLEEACTAAFQSFKETGQTDGYADLPPCEDLSWTTLHFQTQTPDTNGEPYYKVTAKTSQPNTTPDTEATYRSRYKNLLNKMNLLMSSSQQICWDWDLNTDTMALVGPQECILGFQYSEITNGSSFWIKRIHPQDSEATQRELQAAISGESETWHSEYRCQNSDEQYLWIKQFGVVTQRHEDGTASNMLGTTQLIEDRKQTENEKLQLLNRYRAIAESQGDAVLRVRADHKITYYNTVFAKRFLDTTNLELDITLEEALRLSPSLDPLINIVEASAQDHQQHSFITNNRDEEARPLRYLWHTTPLQDKLTATQEIQFSGRDVSTLKTLEDALVSSNRENQAKDRFLAMISHELKTPLNPILGFSEILMRRPNIESNVATIAESINTAGHQLHSHINSLLEISKMDPEIYLQQSEPHTLNSLRDDFETTFALKAERKEITFLTSLSGARQKRFSLDTKLLRNVLNNLIDNAIKFTTQGKVLLLLTLKPSTQEQPQTHLQFKVIDDGPGIPEENLKQIFEPFVRVDSSTTRETEGAGLGLSICQRALNILGGQIKASPNPTTGMTFSGFIPVDTSPHLEHDQQDQLNQPSFKPDTNTRTLIVDDIASNREVLSEVLSELELNAETCADGSTAIQLLTQAPYDIVFLDVHMPHMNGIETHRKLSTLPNKKHRPYVVAVTADSTPQTRQTCTQSGIDDFITKPISRSKITRVLGDYHKKKTQS